MLAASLMLITAFVVQTPPDTLRYQVVNHGRHAGTMDVVAVADTIVVHVRSWDRAREANVTTRYLTDETGRIVRLEVSTAVRPNPFERFALADGTARWRTPVDSGTADVDGPTFYWPRAYTVYNAARLAAFLLEQPQRTAGLLPFHAPASAHVAIDTVVAADGGSERIRLVVMDVPAFAPYLVWLDARDELFASDAAWLTTVRSGFDSVLPVLRFLERRVLAERSEAVARRLTTPRTGPLVIRNGNLFDSEAATIRTGMTVVVEGERITAVGADGSVPIPAGATILDAAGKTILPGLWDMHGHIDGWREGRAELGGILALANGITTVRDLAADVDRAVRVPDTVRVAPPTGEQETDRASILAALDEVEPGGTVQFAPGTYLVGTIIPVPQSGITLQAHPSGTTLQGCDPGEAGESVLDCGVMVLQGGGVTLRGFTIEQTRLGVCISICRSDPQAPIGDTVGGYRIEDNTFRNSLNGVRGQVVSSDTSFIRDNRFINTFHAVSFLEASNLHVIDNRISAPEPEEMPGLGHVSFAIAVGGDSNLIARNRIEGYPDGILLAANPGGRSSGNVIRGNTIAVARNRLPDRDSPALASSDPADSTIVGVPLALHGLGGSRNTTEAGRVSDNLVENNRILGGEESASSSLGLPATGSSEIRCPGSCRGGRSPGTR